MRRELDAFALGVGIMQRPPSSLEYIGFGAGVDTAGGQEPRRDLPIPPPPPRVGLHAVYIAVAAILAGIETSSSTDRPESFRVPDSRPST